MTIANNPILGGFYPDPSICRVGEDFYLVNSSFGYAPGIPIFHSRDLAHWEQLGNVLERDTQLRLDHQEISRGIFAPTIRYHDGVFYVITTNVSYGGTFLVTASDPAGPWSDPYELGEGAAGIDPSLFFDDDGRCYYVGTRPNPDGTRYDGDWEIWVQELDLDAMRLVGGSMAIWKGAAKHAIWPEGPHLYKKDGYYYLLIAEGGTELAHSICMARSRQLFAWFEGCPRNPVFTHRHLGHNYPVICAGHGDLFDDSDGNWYLVLLASRACDRHCCLRLYAAAGSITETEPCAYLGVRQSSYDATVRCGITFLPQGAETAGLVLYQNHNNHLRIEIAQKLDLLPYTTEAAGGFVGCTVGMYASGNGTESDNYADVEYFTYKNDSCE